MTGDNIATFLMAALVVAAVTAILLLPVILAGKGRDDDGPDDGPWGFA